MIGSDVGKFVLVIFDFIVNFYSCKQNKHKFNRTLKNKIETIINAPKSPINTLKNYYEYVFTPIWKVIILEAKKSGLKGAGISRRWDGFIEEIPPPHPIRTD